MPVAAKVLKKSSKELADLWRSLKNQKTLYRFKAGLSDLEDQKVKDLVQARLAEKKNFSGMMPSEPRGMYFSNDLKNLHPLIDLSEGERFAYDPKTFGSTRESLQSMLDFRGDETKSASEQILRAKLLPEAKLLEIGSEKEWNDLVQSYVRSLPKDKAASFTHSNWEDHQSKISELLKMMDRSRDEQEREAIRRVLASTRKGKEQELVDLGFDFTEELAKKYDAITFPDVAAYPGQSITQTVVMKPDKIIAKKGRGREAMYRILSLLGAIEAAKSERQ